MFWSIDLRGTSKSAGPGGGPKYLEVGWIHSQTALATARSESAQRYMLRLDPWAKQ